MIFPYGQKQYLMKIELHHLAQIIWLARIMKHHIDFKNEIDNDARVKI